MVILHCWHISPDHMFVCVAGQWLQWFLLVRFCIQQPPPFGSPAVWLACLHLPSPTVWSWWVTTRFLHPTNALKCSGKSSRSDWLLIWISPTKTSYMCFIWWWPKFTGLNTVFLLCLCSGPLGINVNIWRYMAQSHPSPRLWSLSSV